MVRSTCCTIVGASPSDGSSNMTSSGAPIRQRPIASICCSPPDSVPAACPARSASTGNSANTRSRFLRASGARARQHRAHVEILGDRERRKHLAAFGHLADAEIADAMAFPAGDVGAAELDAAARRAVHAGDGADQRGLAGAVRADDGDDRALGDLERHVVERLRVAVEHIEVLDAQHQSTASAPR